VLARGAASSDESANGVVLDDRVAGERHTVRLPAAESAAELARSEGVPDLLVIGLKAHSIPELAPTLTPLIGPDTLVVPAIDGLPWWYFHREGSIRDGMAFDCLDPQPTHRPQHRSGQDRGCSRLCGGRGVRTRCAWRTPRAASSWSASRVAV
jgi:2-dehydropantoate 2-reductase